MGKLLSYTSRKKFESLNQKGENITTTKKQKRAYLAIKFREDNGNKELIGQISTSLEKMGIDCVVMARDFEKWGGIKYSPNELMKLTFQQIDRSDILLIEFSDKGVGLGIEGGYAFAKGIPVIVIAKSGSDISNTLRGISKNVSFYENMKDLPKAISKALR